MFVCKECHEKTRGPFCTLRGSYGPCEECGHSDTCADCHCPVEKRPKQPPREKGPFG